MKWGWDHQQAREVKSKVRFLFLKAHSGILTVKDEQVQCYSRLFPSGCNWAFLGTSRHPRHTSLFVSCEKSCASLIRMLLHNIRNIFALCLSLPGVRRNYGRSYSPSKE